MKEDCQKMDSGWDGAHVCFGGSRGPRPQGCRGLRRARGSGDTGGGGPGVQKMRGAGDQGFRRGRGGGPGAGGGGGPGVQDIGGGAEAQGFRRCRGLAEPGIQEMGMGGPGVQEMAGWGQGLRGNGGAGMTRAAEGAGTEHDGVQGSRKPGMINACGGCWGPARTRGSGGVLETHFKAWLSA